MNNSNTKINSNTEFQHNNIFDNLIYIFEELKNNILVGCSNLFKNILSWDSASLIIKKFDIHVIIKKIVTFFSFSYDRAFLKNDINNELFIYVKLSSAIINFVLIILLVLILINFILSIFNKTFSFLTKILKFFNIIILTSIITLLIFKLYLSLKLEQGFGPSLYDLKVNFFKENTNYFYSEYFINFSSAFSDSIILLSFITGLICLELLGFKNLFKYLNNISLFYMFNIFVIIMVSTNNVLIMFISFEFIFLPTMYFVYKMGYSKKIEKANKYLFQWTLFGSFLVLCALGYIFFKFNTLNYYYIQQVKLSTLESRIIFCIFLLGFGIKIPLAPFHIWLLKVHVESPTAFSIFLSGFLVKSALYCLFILLTLFNNIHNYFILTSWILLSLIVGTIGLSRQIDIKKLIAWATVQEMTFMLLFLIFKQIFLTHTCILFLVLHGLMSSYMFYIVDILQKRYKTRALKFIKGLHLTLPKITKHIWFLILLFSGFPLTAKFFIEWNLIALMSETHYATLVYLILLVNFCGAIFFCKVMFTIIYGVYEKDEEGKEEDFEFIETQKKEYGLLNFLVILILLLLWLIFIF